MRKSRIALAAAVGGVVTLAVVSSVTILQPQVPAGMILVMHPKDKSSLHYSVQLPAKWISGTNLKLDATGWEALSRGVVYRSNENDQLTITLTPFAGAVVEPKGQKVTANGLRGTACFRRENGNVVGTARLYGNGRILRVDYRAPSDTAITEHEFFEIIRNAKQGDRRADLVKLYHYNMRKLKLFTKHRLGKGHASKNLNALTYC